MADPIVNFFKSQLIGEYSNVATSFTISTGDGALLPDPSVDGEYNLVIFEGTAGSSADEFEVVRVTGKSSDTLTVTRGQEGTTPITVTSAFHSIIMAATKKIFDDLRSDIANVDLTSLSNVESITYDATGDEILQIPAGTKAQRPSSPSTGFIRFNTDTESIEAYTGTRWLRINFVEVQTANAETATATITAYDATTISNVIANAERLTFNSSGDESFSLPAGTEAQRPTASAGYMRYNTDEDVVEAYIDGEWVQLDTSAYVVPTHAQGSVSGYTMGGYNSGIFNVVDKFSFTSDGNATDVGDLTLARFSAGASSSTHGYLMGGDDGASATLNYNNIDKTSFSSDGNSTDVGDMTQTQADQAGVMSTTNGYAMSGQGQTSGGNTNLYSISDIERVSFASDTNGVVASSITVARRSCVGQTSSTHGYASGGLDGSGTGGSLRNIIDKFLFSTEANATDVGDLIVALRGAMGQNSSTHGYVSGGNDGSYTNVIQKFSFASDGNSSDVGDLTSAQGFGAGQSSTTHGYVSAGFGGSILNNIEKFTFESDSNSTDVGDLSFSRYLAGGAQV